ncbi:MAG: phosphatase PAP2 family protein, partial [Leptospiraceae bacterium]|nr:phosphatase PAP2 family protein [Leptospiraceae bacterium]
GEVFAVILLGFSFLDQVVYPVIGLLYTGMVAYLNDRLILMVKKRVSRRRPSLRLLDKPNNHPDLNHSFPSAHAANSMLVATILCNEFGYSFVLYFFSLFAGIGRLLTLHHFLSDILGGWLIGIFMGSLGLWVFRFIKEFLLV